MARKIDTLQVLAQQTMESAMTSPESWQNFLNAASNLYTNTFANQLLIYAQRPQATACASMAFWNQKALRWIQAGASGIALIDTKSERGGVRYVFDIADTYSTGYAPQFQPWQLRQGARDAVFAETIPDRIEAPDLQNFEQWAKSLVEEWLAAHSAQMAYAVEDSALVWEENEKQREIIGDFATNSAAYMAARRCGLLPAFDAGRFASITDFDTQQIRGFVGAIMQNTARQMLTEIGRAVRARDSLAKNSTVRHTTVENQPTTNNADKEAYQNEQNERERISVSKLGRTGASGKTAGQIRADAPGVSERTQSAANDRADDGRDALRELTTDGHRSAGTDRADDAAHAASEPRAEQGDRSDGLGAAHEQSESNRRRNGDATDLRITEKEPSKAENDIKSSSAFLRSEPAQLSLFGQLLSPEDQKSSISDAALQMRAERKPNEPYPISERDILDALCTGSGFAKGKYRITRHFTQSQNRQDNAAFLKKEYGIGGSSHTLLNGDSGYIHYDSKGWGLGGPDHFSESDILLKWPQVADRIGLLIHTHKYLNADEQKEYADWLAAQAKTEELPWTDSNKLSREEQPLAVGNVVFLEEDHPFVVESIGIWDVHLRDELFPLIDRAINRTELARLVAENPKNKDVLPALDETPPQMPNSAFVEKVMADVDRITEDATPYPCEPINYTAPYHGIVQGTPKQRAAGNIEAIRTLKRIEQRVADDGNPANAEEQEVLARYCGWGGLSDAFDASKSSWGDEYATLRSLLDEDEYRAARASTLTAFFTPPEVIHAMYRALERMGVKGGNILEPSMGVGAFFANKPSSFEENPTQLYGVELDSITGRISRQLYQKAHISVYNGERFCAASTKLDLLVG